MLSRTFYARNFVNSPFILILEIQNIVSRPALYLHFVSESIVLSMSLCGLVNWITQRAAGRSASLAGCVW